MDPEVRRILVSDLVLDFKTIFVAQRNRQVVILYYYYLSFSQSYIILNGLAPILSYLSYCFLTALSAFAF